MEPKLSNVEESHLYDQMPKASDISFKGVNNAPLKWFGVQWVLFKCLCHLGIASEIILSGSNSSFFYFIRNK